MKKLLVIWLIALAAVVGVYAYIFASIDQKLLEQDAEDSLQVMERIETVNPQTTNISGSDIQPAN